MEDTEKIDRPLQHNGIGVPIGEVCWAMGAHPGLTSLHFLEEVISTLRSEGWVELSQRKGGLRSLLEEGTMAVQQLRKGRVNSSERLEYLVGETRQKKSMWLHLGENLLFLLGRRTTGRLTMWGQSTQHKAGQEARVWDSYSYQYQRPDS